MSYKLRITTVLFTLFLLILACGRFEVGVEPNAISFNLAQTKASSSTEEISPECSLSDFEVYINHEYDYCFGYPADFRVADPSSKDPEIRGREIGSEIEPIFATLRIEVDPIDGDISLQEQAENYLREFSVVDPTIFTWTEIELDGETGLLVEPIPVQLSWKIIFVSHNGYLFRLMYWPVDVPEAEMELRELYQLTSQTFRFIN